MNNDTLYYLPLNTDKGKIYLEIDPGIMIIYNKKGNDLKLENNIKIKSDLAIYNNEIDISTIENLIYTLNTTNNNTVLIVDGGIFKNKIDIGILKDIYNICIENNILLVIKLEYEYEKIINTNFGINIKKYIDKDNIINPIKLQYLSNTIISTDNTINIIKNRYINISKYKYITLIY